MEIMAQKSLESDRCGMNLTRCCAGVTRGSVLRRRADATAACTPTAASPTPPSSPPPTPTRPPAATPTPSRPPPLPSSGQTAGSGTTRAQTCNPCSDGVANEKRPTCCLQVPTRLPIVARMSCSRLGLQRPEPAHSVSICEFTSKYFYQFGNWLMFENRMEANTVFLEW